jgi:hypothetical protein
MTVMTATEAFATTAGKRVQSLPLAPLKVDLQYEHRYLECHSPVIPLSPPAPPGALDSPSTQSPRGFSAVSYPSS